MADRLYILVDERLSSGQKMSQACHAVAQFMLEHPGEWNNDTIVILDAPKFILRDMIEAGALGYQDVYFDEPRSCAFTEMPEHLQSDVKVLKLAK